MMGNLTELSRAIKPTDYPFEFSICSLVTRKEEYQEMLASFLAHGFTEDCCEFLHADNSKECTFDAYTGINHFLKEAKGKYVIICHQDILLHNDTIQGLRTKLSELDALDKNWGLCGNAGAAAPNHVVYHISYPDSGLKSKGKFPLKVAALDENFLIVKNEACLKVSNDLSGFHLYGADLCLQAELNGFNAYVIAFDVIHKSKGNRNEDFYTIRKALIKKYNHFFRSRWIQTNTTIFHLSGTFLGRLAGNPLSLFFAKMYYGLKKKI